MDKGQHQHPDEVTESVGLLSYIFYVSTRFYVSGIYVLKVFGWRGGNRGEPAAEPVCQRPRLDVDSKPWEELKGLEEHELFLKI